MDDPRNRHEYGLWLDAKPYVVAVADDTGLVVYRSVALSLTDDRYQPVSDHVLDHRMVLAGRKIIAEGVTPGMCGQVEWSHWR